MPRTPEFQGLLDAAQDEMLQDIEPSSASIYDDVDPAFLDDSDSEELGKKERKKLDKEVDGVVSAGMARDYTVRKEGDHKAEKLYREVKNDGYSREEVQQNYKQISNQRDESRLQGTYRNLAQADTRIVDEINSLVGSGDLKSTEDIENYSKLNLILRSPWRGFKDLWENDDIEEFFESQRNYDPLFATEREKTARRQEAVRISKVFKRRQAFNEAILKHWEEEAETQGSLGDAINKAWESGEIPTSEILAWLNYWKSHGKSIADLFRAAPSMAPSIAAGLLAPLITPLGSGAVGLGTGGLIARDSRIVERMQDHGVDFTNPDSILAFFDNPELVEKIASDANRYATTIGVAEGAGGLVGGKITTTMFSKKALGFLRKASIALGLPVAEAIEEGSTEALGEHLANVVAGTPEKNSAVQFIENFVMGGVLGGGVGAGKTAAKLLTDNGDKVLAKREEIAKEEQEKENAKEEPTKPSVKQEAAVAAKESPPPIPRTEGEPTVSEEFDPGEPISEPPDGIPDSPIIDGGKAPVVDQVEAETKVEPPPVPVQEQQQEVDPKELGEQETEPTLNLQTVVDEGIEAYDTVEVITEFSDLLLRMRGDLGIEGFAIKNPLKSVEMLMDSVKAAPFIGSDSDFRLGEAIGQREWWRKNKDGTYEKVPKGKVEQAFNTPEILKDFALQEGGATFEESVETLIHLNRRMKKALEQDAAQVRVGEAATRRKEYADYAEKLYGTVDSGIGQQIAQFYDRAMKPLEEATGLKDFGAYNTKDAFVDQSKFTHIGERGMYSKFSGAIGVNVEGGTHLEDVSTMIHEMVHNIVFSHLRAYHYLKTTPKKLTSKQQDFVDRMDAFEDGMSDAIGMPFNLLSVFTDTNPFSQAGIDKVGQEFYTEGMRKQVKLGLDSGNVPIGYYFNPSEMISLMSQILLASNPKLLGLDTLLAEGDKLYDETLIDSGLNRELSNRYESLLSKEGHGTRLSTEVEDLFKAFLSLDNTADEVAEPMLYSLAPKASPDRQQGLINAWKDASPEVKNPDGTPITVYHGTTENVETFEPSIAKGIPGEFLSRGGTPPLIYTTTDPDTANAYAGEGPGANVLPLHINMKKPLVLNEFSFSPFNLHQRIAKYGQALARGDYDGIVVKFREPFGVRDKWLIPLKPEQVESAIQQEPMLYSLTPTKVAKTILDSLMREYAANSRKRASDDWINSYENSIPIAEEKVGKQYPVLRELQAFFESYAIDPKSVRDYLVQFRGQIPRMPRNLTTLKAALPGKEVVSIEEAATIMGYESGIQLINESTKAPNWKLEVERLAKDMADAANGIESYSVSNMLTDSEIATAREIQYKGEMEVLREKIPSAYKHAQKQAGRRLPKMDDVKQVALDRVAGMSVKRIRGDVHKQYQRENVFRSKFAQAWAQGDYAKAMALKVQEAEAYWSAHYGRIAIRQIEARNRRMIKWAKENFDSSKRDRQTMAALKSLLTHVGLHRSKDRKLVAHLNGLKKYNPEGYETVMEKVRSIIAGLSLQGPMTVSQHDDVYNTAKALREQATDLMNVYKENKMQNKQEVIGGLLADMQKLPEDPKPEDKSTIRALLSELDDKLTVAGTWLQTLDARMGNTFFEDNVVAPIVDGEKAYIEAYEKHTERFRDMVTKTLGDDKESRAILDAPVQVEAIGHTFKTKLELLGALLHTGNHGNLSRLLIGYGWGKRNDDGTLDRSRWDDAMAEMIRKGHLTKKDFDFAQATWDMIEELLPDAQRTHYNINKLYFNEVTPQSFKNKFGEYRGGYYPAIATEDAQMIREFKQLQKEAFEGVTISMILPTVQSSWTKDRVPNNADPLALDPTYAIDHARMVLKYIHMQEAVTRANKLFVDTTVKNEAGNTLPQEFNRIKKGAYKEILRPWITDTVQQKRATFGSPSIEKMSLAAKNFAAFKIMFLNLSNSALQLTGPFLAMPQVGALRVLKGTLTSQIGGAKRRIYEASSVMRIRRSNHMNKVLLDLEQYKTDLQDRRGISRIYDWTYTTQGITQAVVDRGVWSAGYSKAITELGADHAAAVRYADELVIDTQGSADVSRLAPIEKAGGFGKLFTMFSRFSIMRYNLMKREGFRFGLGPQLFQLWFYAAFLPEVMASAIYKMAYDDEDEEFSEALADTVVDGFYGSTAGLVPIVGRFLHEGLKYFTVGGDYKPRFDISPVQGELDGIINALDRIQKRADNNDLGIEDLAEELLKTLAPRSALKGARGLGIIEE